MKSKFRLACLRIYMSTTVKLTAKLRQLRRLVRPARSRTSNLWLAVQRRQFRPTLIVLRPSDC
jgi:hypothetical protein